MYFVNTAPVFKVQMCVTLDFYYVDPNFHQVAWCDPCLCTVYRKYCGQKRVSEGLGFRAKVIEKLSVDFDRVVGDEPWW